jgi:molecular chaperone GrpE
MSKKKHKETQDNKKENNNETQTNEVDLDTLQKEKEELQQKLDEALRAYAKCENDKKLLQKESDSAIEYAYEKFALLKLQPLYHSLLSFHLLLLNLLYLQNRVQILIHIIEANQLPQSLIKDMQKA